MLDNELILKQSNWNNSIPISKYHNASGDNPDDDTGISDTTESEGDDESGFTEGEKVKARPFIREKKLSLKAQYGKGYLYANRKIRLAPKKNEGDRITGAEAIILISSARGGAISRKRGWRYQWKQIRNQFKADLKQKLAAGITPTSSNPYITDPFASAALYENEIKVQENSNETKSTESKTMWQNPMTYVIGGGGLAVLIVLTIVGIKILKK